MKPNELSAWAPLQDPLFRGLWIASVISFTGTWMQNLVTGWLMTELTMSPMRVSLLQVANSLPVFLIALPAGAVADMLDRRLLLLATQTWMVMAAATLGIITLTSTVTPWILLVFTFLLGLGAVMNDPAWQAITPEIISGEQHASAVALNSAGFNVARAIGPAIGGMIVAAAGAGIAFLLNAVSFLGVIFFLYRWKRSPVEAPAGPERVLGSIRTGLAYARSSPAVRSLLVRTLVFSFAASAFWALLPLVARPHGAVGYGLLLGCFGLGAVAAAGVLPRLRRRMSVDALVAAATAVFALVTLACGYFSAFAVLCALLFAGGSAWIAVLAALNVTAQTMAPAWMRGRALSVYLLVLQGGLAAGSLLWGSLASSHGMSLAFASAATALLAGLAVSPRYPLGATGVSLQNAK